MNIKLTTQTDWTQEQIDKAYKVMRDISESHRDSCGEINATGLAEETCQIQNGYIEDDIPQEYFELSVMFD
jgi:hypothetical protein